MAFIHKIIQWGSDFFKSFKSDNKKQLAELEKLEKQIESLKAKENDKKPGISNFVLDNMAFLRFWFCALVIVAIAYFAFQSLEILYLILTAYIVSLAIEAIIGFFQKRIRYRWLSIALAYFFLIVVFLWSLMFIVPFLLNQLSDILSVLTANISHLQQVLQNKPFIDIVRDTHRLPAYIKKALLDSLQDPTLWNSIQYKFQDSISQLANMGTVYAQAIWSWAVNLAWSIVGFIKEISIILTLAVLFSIQKDSVMRFLANLGGEKSYKEIYMKLERIYKKLWIWFKSQLSLCIFIGATMLLSFRILGLFGMPLPQMLSLALIGALTEIVPYFGPLLWWSIAVIVAFVHFGLPGALIVLAIIIVIQWLENNVFIPLLMNKTLGANPVVIFISMIIWSLIMGIVGVLLAVPIAVIITMFADRKFEEEGKL